MHLLGLALSFPAVIFTVLLGVVLVYWLLVIAGAAQVDALGEGAIDGAVDGAIDGAVEQVGHGHGHGHGGEGALAGMLEALRLRSAPATVVLSCVVLFSWLITMVGMLAVEMAVARGALLLVAPMLSLLPTSLALRPLAPIFVTNRGAAHADLVGKVCVVRTGTVTDRFGEAQVADGGAGLVVRVRVASGQALSRGEEAVIVGYDETRQEFTVAPLSAAEEVLAEARASRRRDAK